MAKTKDVSHEEVWDDTALVDSWNEALAEYKKYHSLAAKGEKIEHVLDEAEERENEDFAVSQADTTLSGGSDLAATTNNNYAVSREHRATTTPSAPPMNGDTQAPPAAAVVPQALMNGGERFHTSHLLHDTETRTVPDEGLKNLMMSWYYAGYYTGLYEGQQKAYATMQQRPEG